MTVHPPPLIMTEDTAALLKARLRHDPYLKIWRFWAVAYIIAMAIGLLWPFDMVFDAKHLNWVAFQKGVLASRAALKFDVLLNIIIFIPMGFLLAAATGSQSFWKSGLFALVMSSLISLSGETLQYFSPRRQSSLVDWMINSASSVIGIMFFFQLLWLRLRHADEIHQLFFSGSEEEGAAITHPHTKELGDPTLAIKNAE